MAKQQQSFIENENKRMSEGKQESMLPRKGGGAGSEPDGYEQHL
jgi:hypothetical protein